MVEYSVCVAVFAFVPYLLDATLGSQELAWRVASGGLVVAWSTIGLAARRRARVIFDRPSLSVAPTFTSVTSVVGYAGAAVLVSNALGFPIRSPGASYIVGLFLPLLQSALYFLRTVSRGDPLHRDSS